MIPSGRFDKIIHDYVLQARENFVTAVNIYNAFPAIQEAVVRDFLSAFAKKLTEVDSGQNTIRNDYIVNYRSEEKSDGVGINLSKTGWNNRFSIFLGADRLDRSDNVYLGVWRDPVKTRHFDSNALSSKLNDILGKGEELPNWVWWRRFDKPYDDWSSTGLLVDLRFSPKELIIYYRERLGKVIELAEKEIDKAV